MIIDGFLWRAALGAGLLAAACGPIGCFILWRRLAYVGESVRIWASWAPRSAFDRRQRPGRHHRAGDRRRLVMARASDRTIPAGTFVGIVGHIGLASALSCCRRWRPCGPTARLFVRRRAGADQWRSGRYRRGRARCSGSDPGTVEAALRTPQAGPSPPPKAMAARSPKLVFSSSPPLWWRSAQSGRRSFDRGAPHHPPAAARPLARSPEAMAVWAAILGALSAPLGLAVSLLADAPAGPCIVLAAGSLFALSAAFAALRRL